MVLERGARSAMSMLDLPVNRRADASGIGSTDEARDLLLSKKLVESSATLCRGDDAGGDERVLKSNHCRAVFWHPR